MKARRHATSVVPAAAVALIVMSVVPALVVRGQSTPQTVPVSGLVSLLDQDMAAFGLFANFAGVGNAPLDAITHAGDRTIDLVMYDLEHSPFDVAGLQTYIQFLLDPGAIARAGDVRASKTVIARIPAYGRELDKNTWMVKNCHRTAREGSRLDACVTASGASRRASGVNVMNSYETLTSHAEQIS